MKEEPPCIYAGECQKTTLQMAQRAGDRHAEWQALMDLGFLWAQRDYTQTGTYYQQAIVLFQQLDDRQGLTSSLPTLMALGGI